MSAIRLYNTLTKSLEDFEPLDLDEDRRVAGQGAHDATGRGDGLVAQSRVLGQRAAARTGRTADRHGDARRAEDAGGRHVHLALPRIHHAAGEEPDVVAGGRQPWLA